jgi:hypothetical protein
MSCMVTGPDLPAIDVHLALYDGDCMGGPWEWTSWYGGTSERDGGLQRRRARHAVFDLGRGYGEVICI